MTMATGLTGDLLDADRITSSEHRALLTGIVGFHNERDDDLPATDDAEPA